MTPKLSLVKHKVMEEHLIYSVNIGRIVSAKILQTYHPGKSIQSYSH